MDTRSFELSLLKRMSPDIRGRVMGAYNVTSEQVDAIAAECPIQLPDRGLARIEDYAQLIGRPVRQQAVATMRSTFVGLTESAFILPSWPHLFWMVYETREGTSINIGFQNQYNIPRRVLEPHLFVPDRLTHSVIYNAALKDEYEDGWDEQLVRRLEFEGAVYEAEFVWGLLQSWRKL